MNMSSGSDDESGPVAIRKGSPYAIIQAANRGKPTGIDAMTEFRELSEAEIKGIPGAEWLYKNYTDTHLLYLRTGHTICYGLELVLFLIGLAVAKDDILKVTDHTMTPFTLRPEFVIAGWVFLLLLESVFIYMIFQKTMTAVALLAEQLKWYYFPKYLLIGTYYFLAYRDGFTIALVNVVLLALLSPLLFFIYHRVKYQDDGRFFVTRLEFIALHVNISLYVAWILIQVFVKVFVFISYTRENTQANDLYLGWDNATWSIIANVVLFCLGVISLSSYKDVFFNIVVIYCFIGIYIEQVNCPDYKYGNCQDKIKTTLLVLGCILFFFVILVFLLYREQILYRRRK